MSDKTNRHALAWLWIFLGLVAIVAFSALFVQIYQPQPEPLPEGLYDVTVPTALPAGETDFTAIRAEDLLLSDDLTVTDDASFGDDVSVDGDLDVDATFDVTGASSFTGAITGPAIGTENLRLPTIESATIITTTDGAIWTVGATEVWWIDRVFCNVTTNFDCTGDDCTIEIGLTGGDIDGFLDLDDGELQTTDAEIAGLTAGWQGFGSTDTRGAFFAAGGGVILANDTIDIKIEDNSASTNPTAGAATCYVVYTRLQ
jgi:hypothetical protein